MKARYSDGISLISIKVKGPKGEALVLKLGLKYRADYQRYRFEENSPFYVGSRENNCRGIATVALSCEEQADEALQV